MQFTILTDKEQYSMVTSANTENLLDKKKSKSVEADTHS